ATIGGSGQVVSINGDYRAGTPLPILTNLVQGGSGGGGNNYTGSKGAYDNFTACIDPDVPSLTRSTTSATMEANNAELYADEIRVLPNPASDHINLSFVPKYSGSSKIIISALDGKRLIEIDYGLTQAGNKYLKRIDMSKLANGIYIVQIINATKMTTKKIVVQR
ncbi:MAG TPA: T9SS type A sorting domain-containing protein, partial [Chitinophagaceae bacterium]|nr:T9SS type A sorting domain-containing protein [Chitinophagaceae bacterium]